MDSSREADRDREYIDISSGVGIFWAWFLTSHTDITIKESGSGLSEAPEDLDLTTNDLIQVPVCGTSSE